MLDQAIGKDAAVTNRKRPRRVRNRGVTRDDDLMLKVVLSRYLPEGLPSCDPITRVARELGISAEQVTAFLDRAHKTGLCVTSVNIPYEVIQAHVLAQRLCRHFDLKQVILVPGFLSMLRELSDDQRRRVHSAVIRMMMPRVAALLDGVVADAAQAETDCTVSVAWGRTMRMFTDHLHQSQRTTAWPRMRVMPLLGPTAWLKTDPVEADVIAMRVASAYGGTWGRIPCPAFVRAEHFDSWIAHDEVKATLQHLLESRCVITSLGPIPPSPDLIDVTLSNDPAMSDALADDARRAGAVGEINYWAFKANGEPAETAYRAIGLGFEGLQRLSADARRSVVLVCGGDRHRIPALKGALAARLCNVLVSDTVTARELLGEPQPPDATVNSMPAERPVT